VGGDPTGTAHSESAAELLAAELAAGGLPIDVDRAEQLIASYIGARPASEADAAEARRRRDDSVLHHAGTGAESTDLRNPAQVRELLASVGIEVTDTRSWRLENFRGAHPLVGELLAWRKAERIATTYGYGWLDANVGPDGRLRGSWSGSDGAAGRMTAGAGLHNLPAELRPAVAADPGCVFVRADLGQIEPRVLAAVSGDRAFVRATLEDDL
jgi:DNA polymerase-1